jgi:hypothetical protein
MTEYKLKKPILFAEEEIKIINLKKPFAGQFRKVLNEEKKGDMLFKLLEVSIDKNPSILNKMDLDDFFELQGVAETFLPAKFQKV